MTVTLNQPSMSGGEITPAVLGRVDMDVYRIGLARAQNFFVNYHGGIKNRPGMKYIGNAKINGPTVLIPFQFSVMQTYMLEFGAGYIRFITNGGYVVDGGNIVEIPTPYAADELDRITYTQSADILSLFHRNHPILQLKRLSNTSWQLDQFVNSGGPFETINVDKSKTIYASGQTGTVTLTANFDVFIPEMVGKLIFLEQKTSDEVRTWIQRMEVVVGQKVYYAGNYYEAAEAPLNGTTKAQTGDTPPTHTEGTIWDGPGEDMPDDNRNAIIGVAWRYLHSGYGIARIDSIASPTEATATVVGTLPESIVGGSTAGQQWDFPGETTRRDYPITPTSNFVFDFKVTLIRTDTSQETPLNYPSQYTINFSTDTVTLLVDPGYEDPNNPPNLLPRDVKIEQVAKERDTYKWAFEPWRSDNKHPQCGTYYQQRFSVASTEQLPQTLWMSRTDSFTDFSTSRPILADDSMRFDVNSLQVNEILHMAPLNALLLFTAGGVWSINQGSNDVITPENPPSVRIQSYDGASPLRPIITGSTALYVQDGGQIVRDIGFEFARDSYVGNDVTVRATHLFEGKEIVSWAYSKNPNKLIIVVFDDGSMAAFTYMIEQQVWGWCPWVTDGKVKWVASVREGKEDAVYFVVERLGVAVVERLSTRTFLIKEDQFFVDSGLTYDGRNTAGTNITISGAFEAFDTCTMNADASYFTADMVGRSIIFDTGDQKTDVLITGYTSSTVVAGEVQRAIPESIRNTPTADWGLSATNLAGLDHLEGKEVSILADGAVVSRREVSSGSVTLDYPAIVVHVGLPYESICQTLDVELSQPPETSRTRRKVVSKVNAVIRDTMGIKAGTSLDYLEDLKSRMYENYSLSPRDKTEVVEITVTDGWNQQGRVYIVQDDPVATEILSIMPEIAVSEN